MNYDNWKLETPPNNGARISIESDINKDATKMYLEKGFDESLRIAQKYASTYPYWGKIEKELLRLNRFGLSTFKLL